MPVVLGWYIFLSFSLGLLHAKSDRLCRYVCLSVFKNPTVAGPIFFQFYVVEFKFGYNRTKLSDPLVTIGQKYRTLLLQSDKNIRPFGYNRTKISDPLVTIGQEYQTLWLQSDKNIRPFGYNRTKISDPLVTIGQKYRTLHMDICVCVIYS